MKKLLSVIVVLMIISISYGQPEVDIPLTASDGSGTIQLAVGLDTAATNGIDPGLGESDLPPFPPQGVFEIRFDLALYAGEPLSTYKDYRFAASFPYSGMVQHSLKWQMSAPGLPINIQYDIPFEAIMIIKDQITGTILNSGPLTGVGSYSIPGTLTSLNAAFVEMTYNTIPVELTSFTASADGDEVFLKWTTATELNNQGFEIERSTTEQNWMKIGYVSGNGTTTEPNSYFYIDKNISEGKYYYRLKQIDFDGQFEYSNEVEVVVVLKPSDYELFQNYPNPFNPTTTINFSIPEISNVKLIVYNSLGQQVSELINTNVAPGNHSYTWDASNLTSGLYFYELRTDKFVSVKKMLLVK